MHIQLDPLGGIAGDMFIAALLDAWPEHAAGMTMAIRAAGLPADWETSLQDYSDGVFSGKRFIVVEPAPRAFVAASGAHAPHVPFRVLRDRLSASRLDAPVRDRALAVFELLAQAEADVHGVAVSEVTFHEVGAWDSVADIVGAAYLIEVLGIKSWSLGPVPLGGGRVTTAHGAMPVPTPATARLLEGFSVIDDGVAGERVTPTGAAVLQHLSRTLGRPSQRSPRPRQIGRSGTGFGTRTLRGISNSLRVLSFDATPPAEEQDVVGVVTFEIDDQTAEDLALGIDALREHDGVLDVLQIPALGKKGRMVAHVQILCRREALQSVIDACFTETTTIGLRWTLSARAKLERAEVQVDDGGQQVTVKVAVRPDGQRSAKSASEDVRATRGRVQREKRRRSAERQALGKAKEDES
jgi:uncharacterized protein (TIGR00299 family) protein